MSEAQPTKSDTRPKGSPDQLVERIKRHYNNVTDRYIAIWGEHMHHGLFNEPNDTKAQAQINVINALLDISKLSRNAKVLDLGCGVGGTSRHLAKEHGCAVTGITISSHQLSLANSMTAAAVRKSSPSSQPPPKASATNEPMQFPGGGSARFLELEAAAIGSHFDKDSLDCVWVCEALHHMPNKADIFKDVFALLAPGTSSTFVLAEWFKAPGLSSQQEEQFIRPIEKGMLAQPLNTTSDYVAMAESAGFKVRQAPLDVSQKTSPTWSSNRAVVHQNPFTALGTWLLGLTLGRDGLGYVSGMKAMKRGYDAKAFQYALLCFEKP
ncbi:methyltransferase domain-containing protein [Xylariomycetidae sp. FL2044]|nr:methyltransferase domain-containing protein [Xylariomycetidae sp. FL2044]